MIQRGLDDGMYYRRKKITKKNRKTEKGNAKGEIIKTGKKTATDNEREKWGEVLKKATQGFVHHPGLQPSLFLLGMTLSSALSLHWLNRIITLNNYTDIPGKSSLSSKRIP